MKVNTHRSFSAFFALAAFWLAASSAVAGKWTYDIVNNYIRHSDFDWVLSVVRNDKALTVTGVYSSPAATILPLADTVSGG